MQLLRTKSFNSWIWCEDYYKYLLIEVVCFSFIKLNDSFILVHPYRMQHFERCEGRGTGTSSDRLLGGLHIMPWGVHLMTPRDAPYESKECVLWHQEVQFMTPVHSTKGMEERPLGWVSQFGWLVRCFADQKVPFSKPFWLIFTFKGGCGLWILFNDLHHCPLEYWIIMLLIG